MGLKAYTQDRLDMVLAKIHTAMDLLVSEGHEDAAVQFQAEVVDQIESVALDLDQYSNSSEVDPVDAPADAEVQAKTRIRFKKGRPKIRGKKYLCCSEPKRSKSAKGWNSVCSWRAGTKRGNSLVHIKGTTKPRALYAMRGKRPSGKKQTGARKIPWCKGAQHR